VAGIKFERQSGKFTKDMGERKFVDQESEPTQWRGGLMNLVNLYTGPPTPFEKANRTGT
jgi:hypothetical protein